MGSSDRDPRERGVLAAIVLIAAAARCVGLFQHATMPDEAFTFFIAAHPLPQVVQLLKSGDFHPPLIYIIGHALLGWSDQAYRFRLVSAIFGVAGVLATYAVAQRVLGRWALLVAFLVAINPSLVFYDGFFRMYALLWSLCMISWALLLRALDSPRRAWRWVAYALGVTALLYTQYLAFFTIVAQMGYVAWVRRRTAGFWLAIAVALAAFVPWIPVLVVQYPLGGTAYNSLHGHWIDLLQAPPVLIADGLPSVIELSTLFMVVLWAGILAGLTIAVVQRRSVLLALVAPLALQIAYSLISGKLLLGQRYLLQAIPVLIMLLVLLIQTLIAGRARVIGLAIAAVLALLALAGTIDKHFLAPYMPIDWTQYQRFLEAHVRPGDAVVLDSSMVYYVLAGSPVVRDRPLFLIADPHDAAIDGTRASALPRVWFIDYQSQLPDPQALAYKALARTHPQHTTWRSTQAGYGDVVLTTLFARDGGTRGP
jgi:dolichyl-phosphate-mannose-protein mannosyltransferase